MYQIAYGSAVSTLTFIWKIDQTLPDHESCNALALVEVTEILPKYATRDMKQAFIEKYSEATKYPTMVLRSIFQELTEGSSAASSSKETEVDLSVTQFLLSSDHTNLILDLRSLNGQPSSTKIDAFWDECQKYFDEHVAVVSEQRHGTDYPYLPVAVSIEDLQQQVKSRLPDLTPMSSVEWLRLQFCPCDLYTSRALHHTGCFNIKF